MGKKRKKKRHVAPIKKNAKKKKRLNFIIQFFGKKTPKKMPKKLPLVMCVRGDWGLDY